MTFRNPDMGTRCVHAAKESLLIASRPSKWAELNIYTYTLLMVSESPLKNQIIKQMKDKSSHLFVLEGTWRESF